MSLIKIEIETIKLIISSLFILLLLGCKFQDKDCPVDNSGYLVNSVIKDIPTYKSGDTSRSRMKLTYEERLNLKSLENGYDSLQIRIWMENGFSDKGQLVILRYTNSD